jgi:hypothetical protein
MRDNSFAMRIKNVLSLIAFAAAFAVSVALVALTTGTTQAKTQVALFQADYTTRTSITAFLEQDISNGHQRNHRVYRYEDGASLSSPYLLQRAQAVSDYSEVSGSMDFNHLPSEFQLAWLKHMRAWHNYADFLQKNKTRNMNSAEFYRLENQYNREINLTWYETLRVASRFGAEIPADAY